MKIDRRRAMQTTAALLTATSLPTLAQMTGALTLVDATLTEGDLHAAGAAPSTRAAAIQPDLVRQWRDGLSSQIRAAGAATAYVRWDKALLLAGLARESRMRCGTRQLDRSVFAVSLSQ
jgi:hypothetical protein